MSIKNAPPNPWRLKVGPMRGDIWDIVDALKIQKKGGVRIEESPFEGFVQRAEADALRRWLGPGACFGGTVLITGDRGSGKTSGVNRALFDCSVLGVTGCSEESASAQFHNLDTILSGAGESGTYSFTQFRKKVSGIPKGRSIPSSGEGPIRLLVPVHINLSRRLSGDDLTRRVVRELYWALVRSGVVAFAPDLVAAARKASFRTCATLGEVADEEFRQKFVNETSFKVSGGDGFVAQAAVAVHEEIKLAQRMSLEFGVSSPAEMDEQLIRLLDEVSGTVYGSQPTPLQRVSRIAGSLVETVRDAKATIFGAQGVRVSVVFILDEIDKMDHWLDRDQESDRESILRSGAEPVNMRERELRIHISQELEALVSRVSPKASPRDKLEEIITTIKPILTHGQATFLLVAGPIRGLRWTWRRSLDQSVLDSIVAEHIHFGLLDLERASAILEDRLRGIGDYPEGSQGRTLLAGWLLVECRGSYHRCISLLRRLWVDDSGAAELLKKRPGAVVQALLGLLVEALCIRPRAGAGLQPESVYSDLVEMDAQGDNAVLLDELRRTFLLIAAGDRHPDGVMADWTRLLGATRPKESRGAALEPTWMKGVLQAGGALLGRWREALGGSPGLREVEPLLERLPEDTTGGIGSAALARVKQLLNPGAADGGAGAG